MKQVNLYCLALFLMVTISGIVSCSSENDPFPSISMQTFDAEEISDYEVTLSANIPLKFKDDFEFEISKLSTMEESVHYNVVSQIILPNSLENTVFIKAHIDDLEPETKYYFRTSYTERTSGEKTYGDIKSFTTIAPQQVDLTMGNAWYSDSGKEIKAFNANITLTAGTISGEIEKYNICQVNKDREGGKNKILPSIKTWKKGLMGDIYAYHLWNSDDNKSIYVSSGKDLEVQESNNVLYYKSLGYYSYNIYSGHSNSFTSDIILKPSMAEINLTITNSTSGILQVFIRCLNKSKPIFSAGWLDLTTGLWTMDEEKSKDLSGNNNFRTVFLGMDFPTSIRTVKFFYPPTEFEENEILIHTNTGYIQLPKTKWEAGKVYKYKFQEGNHSIDFSKFKI